MKRICFYPLEEEQHANNNLIDISGIFASSNLLSVLLILM